MAENCGSAIMRGMTKPTNSKLRSFRRRVGASAADVAEATGLSPTTITRIELGEKSPRYETALKILAWAAETAKAERVPLRDRVSETDLLPPGVEI